jgi:hypothetical protein
MNGVVAVLVEKLVGLATVGDGLRALKGPPSKLAFAATLKKPVPEPNRYSQSLPVRVATAIPLVAVEVTVSDIAGAVARTVIARASRSRTAVAPPADVGDLRSGRKIIAISFRRDFPTRHRSVDHARVAGSCPEAGISRMSVGPTVRGLARAS